MIDGYANGANFIVPPGYPNDSYMMRVQSGEHVTVDNGGAGSGITFIYSPVVSLADEYEAQTKLMPFIQAALRGNQ